MNPDDSLAHNARTQKTRWFICLFLWWMIALFVYLAVTARENRLTDAVVMSGVQATRQSAETAGLPLLERDVQALTQLAKSVAEAPDVVNVLIIDHRNKIIAYTDMASLVPNTSMSVHVSDGVAYWPQTLSNGVSVIFFSAPIYFSGTKIGEVLVARSAGNTGTWRLVFIGCAVASLLIIGFALLVADYHGIRPLRTAVLQRWRRWIGGEAESAAEHDLICPLCGHQKPLTRTFMLEANLDRYPVLRAAALGNPGSQLLNATGLHLREIARRTDLGWFRLQMIHRCADIIKRLAGD